MQPISDPIRTYLGNPDKKLPAKCPQCGCVLEHFLARPGPGNRNSSPPEDRNPSPRREGPSPRASGTLVKVIDLYGQIPGGPQTGSQELTDGVTIDPLPAGTEVGDFFEEEPSFARATEMQISRAKETRQSAKAIPQEPVTVVEPRPVRHPNYDALRVLDHDKIGGKVTIFALLFGDHHELHRRCLNSIVETVPPSRMDLRVGANQICLETRNYLRSLPITKIYENTKVRRKYGAMREMFYDPNTPIGTKWVIWFDDDSYVRNPQWLGMLGAAITGEQDPKVAMFGVRMLHVFKPGRKGKDPRKWFQNASWWRGLHFRTKQGADAPNGNTIHFIVGGFWALKTDAIAACEIPDMRLNHNGGDICIGEQLHQNDYGIRLFNRNKEIIHTSASPRRGFNEVFPWYR